MIRIGLVGVGGFAATWRRVLAELESEGVATLAAVAERDRLGQRATLDALAAQGCAVYGSLTEMLAEHGEHIDLVGLPVGIPWHHELAREALESSHHVLVEKPFTATVHQAVALMALAKERNLHLEVAYQFMYSPTIRGLGRRIQRGDYGQVQSLSSVIGWPRTASYYARNSWAGRAMLGDLPVLDGPATNATAHHLMNMLYLGACAPGTRALAEIDSVQAELYRCKPITGYDTSSIRVTLTNGARLVHNASHATAKTIPPQMEIRLERATIQWVAQTDHATITYNDGHVQHIANPAPGSVHALPLRHMIATVGGDRTVPGETLHCTAAMATRHVQVINMALVSSGGIHSIAPCHRQTVYNEDSLIVTQDMPRLIRDAHAAHDLLSYAGAPWSVATQPVRVHAMDTFSISDWTRAKR